MGGLFIRIRPPSSVFDPLIVSGLNTPFNRFIWYPRSEMWSHFLDKTLYFVKINKTKKIDSWLIQSDGNSQNCHLSFEKITHSTLSTHLGLKNIFSVQHHWYWWSQNHLKLHCIPYATSIGYMRHLFTVVGLLVC